MSLSNPFRLFSPKLPLSRPCSKSISISTFFLFSKFQPPCPSLSSKPSNTTCFCSSSSALSQHIQNLPPNLQSIITQFQSVHDHRSKYEQLMFYGRNLPPLDARFKTVENKVQGCVSQVWVRAFLDADRNVQFEADSDSSLTKGLAALLVEGLSGRPAAEIARVPPDFVQMLGLQQSLTPSRNNGFLNMLRLMQKKALELDMGAGDTVGRANEGITGVDDDDQGLMQKKAAKAVGDSVSAADSGVEHGTIKDLNFEVNGNGESHSKSDGVFNFGEIELSSELDSHTSSSSSEIKLSSEAGLGSRAQKIKEILEKELCPVELELEDISHQHAGHAGVRGGVGETHFNLKIVSKEFQGKSLVKRHRIVYDLLQDELKSGLHALSIVAKTPSEVGGR